MGLNFEEITHGKVGDIIYPAFNGTNGLWKTSRWDLVMGVDDKGRIIKRNFMWSFCTVKAIELMKELQEKQLNSKRRKTTSRRITR